MNAAMFIINAMMAVQGGRRSLSGGIPLGFNREPAPKKEQMPLTEEEKMTLETLSGKRKKAFIKDLKLKYGLT